MSCLTPWSLAGIPSALSVICREAPAARRSVVFPAESVVKVVAPYCPAEAGAGPVPSPQAATA